MYSKVTIMGHPVHPMLVAYPVAFYTGTFVSYVIYGATADAFWLRVAIALNVAGVVMAMVAALPGLIDWAVGVPSGTPAKRTGAIHMTFNLITLALYAVTLFMYIGEWNGAGDVSATPGIILGALGTVSLLVAGFNGWRMVQDHHVGVKLSQEQEQIDHELETRQLRAS